MKFEFYVQFGTEWVWVGQTTGFGYAEEWLERRQAKCEEAFFVAKMNDTTLPQFLQEQAQ